MTNQFHTELAAQLIDIARRAEALKRECGMDPESPIAIHNAGLMSISYAVRAVAAALESPERVQGDPAEPTDDSDRLKPCPFCGSEAEGCTIPAEQEDVGAGAMFVQCTNSQCMASSALIYPLMDDPKPLLLERWNRRVAGAKIAPLSREAWTWSKACEAEGVRVYKARQLITKWRHAAEHLGLEGLASLADCADELEQAIAPTPPTAPSQNAQEGLVTVRLPNLTPEQAADVHWCLAESMVDAGRIDDVRLLLFVGEAATPSPQSSEGGAEITCPRCNGSGDQEYLVGGGPDAHDETGPCSECDGTGVVAALRASSPAEPKGGA